MPLSPFALSLKTSIYQPCCLKTDDTERGEEEDDGAITAVSPPEEEQAAASNKKPCGCNTPTSTPRKQGRMYKSKYSTRPGGIHVDDMLFGTQMSHLACTDDSEDRLKTSSPNTLAALQEVVDGDADDIRKPLSWILKEKFNLTLDHWISQSGIEKGQPIDTQGFVASNDTAIVLSFRFSTSIKDWLTNLSFSSSEFAPARDEMDGPKCCSCLGGYYTKYCTTRGKPRCHTGYYNNFIYILPDIRQYVLAPLLKPGATPKKVYVCGESLGAAIATLAYCFLLQELCPQLENPNFVHHKLISVTAGCPRVCDHLMRTKMMKKIHKLRPLDRAVLIRLVYHQDMVPHVPFTFIAPTGFVHLDKLVYITQQGDVIVNPELLHSKSFPEVANVFDNFWKDWIDKKKNIKNGGLPTVKHEDGTEKTPFELECETTPEPIKDHMPYWYLTYLKKLKAQVEAGEV